MQLHIVPFIYNLGIVIANLHISYIYIYIWWNNPIVLIPTIIPYLSRSKHAARSGCVLRLTRRAASCDQKRSSGRSRAGRRRWRHKASRATWLGNPHRKMEVLQRSHGRWENHSAGSIYIYTYMYNIYIYTLCICILYNIYTYVCILCSIYIYIMYIIYIHSILYTSTCPSRGLGHAKRGYATNNRGCVAR